MKNPGKLLSKVYPSSKQMLLIIKMKKNLIYSDLLTPTLLNE